MTAGSAFSLEEVPVPGHRLLPDKWEWDSAWGWVTSSLQPAWPLSSFSCRGPERARGSRGLERGWKGCLCIPRPQHCSVTDRGGTE